MKCILHGGPKNNEVIELPVPLMSLFFVPVFVEDYMFFLLPTGRVNVAIYRCTYRAIVNGRGEVGAVIYEFDSWQADEPRSKD